jgi:hypothetical protein
MEETDIPAGAGQDVQPGLHAGSCRPHEALFIMRSYFSNLSIIKAKYDYAGYD